jgi:hypothetical protein
LFLLFAIGGCSRHAGLSDDELSRRLVGTWVADENSEGRRIYGETDFHRDGVQSGSGVVHTVNGTTSLRFNGDWMVRDGHLLSKGEMMKSNSEDIESYRSVDMIERITDEELILVDERGIRTVRHRKGTF